jgi:hypothetical protein
MGCSDSKLGENIKENDNIENISVNLKENSKENEKSKKIDISDESDSSNKENNNNNLGKFLTYIITRKIKIVNLNLEKKQILNQ